MGDEAGATATLGHLGARERVAHLVDEGTFVEHGALAAPAAPHLTAPADGIIIGVGSIDGAPVAVVSYDYDTLAGTQGVVGHAKLDHLLALAHRRRTPLVVFCEGAGARAQEMNIATPGRRVVSFAAMARLSGRVPLVGVVSGRSFGGHAALAGLCDVIVATRDACMGIAGPPFVASATGEVVSPEELGPATLHERTGAVDVVVADDVEAVEHARRYLELVTVAQVASVDPAADPDTLRAVVPDNPRRPFDMHRVLDAVLDEASALELRPRWGRSLLTVLGRLAGRAVGVVANQPVVLAGAIDRDASDKMARFVQLCDSHGVPLVFLVDTPGFLVGSEAEQQALVRHSSRPLVALAHARVPSMTIVVRRAFGLGYFAMGTRPFDPELLVAWPTATFGGMGHRGAAAIVADDGFEASTAERHTPEAFAATFALDDVIDPADTRDLLARTLALVPTTGGSHRPVDPW